MRHRQRLGITLDIRTSMAVQYNNVITEEGPDARVPTVAVRLRRAIGETDPPSIRGATQCDARIPTFG